MQTNIPSDTPTPEEIHEVILSCMAYLTENPYGAIDCQINGAPCTLIAAVESEEMEEIQPLLILPTPELILHLVDAVEGKPIFAIADAYSN